METFRTVFQKLWMWERVYLDKYKCHVTHVPVCEKATGDPHWVAPLAKRALMHHASHFDVHLELCNTHHTYNVYLES